MPCVDTESAVRLPKGLVGLKSNLRHSTVLGSSCPLDRSLQEDGSHVNTTLSTTASARIVIVDDHPLVRQGLRRIVASQPDLEVCGEASGATEALQIARDMQPDLVIVDLTLSEGTGLELIADLRQRLPHVKILVSSVLDDEIYAELALRAGAAAYVNKQAPAATIVEALRKVLAGGVYLNPLIADRLLQATCGNRSVHDNPLLRLSARETEVFHLLGQGLSVMQAAEQLYLSPKTVATHCDGIKAKLNLKNATELKYHAVQWNLRHLKSPPGPAALPAADVPPDSDHA